jgi:hypothetical protein
MPRYHFHLSDGRKIFDPQGMELPDDRAALHYGAQLARSSPPLARELGATKTDWHIEVTREDGATIGRCAPPDESE